MKMLHATAFSTTLNLAQLAAHPSWSILSNHRHACNLLASDGTLIALVDEEHGNGPFHIMVPHARFDRLTLNPSVRWHTEQIELADLTIDVRTARPWNPQLPTLINWASLASLPTYMPLATMRSALYSGSAILVERAQGAIAQLRNGVTRKNVDLFRQGVDGLVGLGPGLTPAGDDFLLGFMVARTIQSGEQLGFPTCGQEIAMRAAKASTRLSATWLSYAGQGYFGQQWHRLIDRLNRRTEGDIPQAVHAILNTGATSGADALCGFFVGIDM